MSTLPSAALPDRSGSGTRPLSSDATRPWQPSNDSKLEQVLKNIRGEIRRAVRETGTTKVQSRFDTSDVIQESMLQIWTQLKAADMGHLEFTRGLLSVIAKGHALKQLRFHTARKRTVNREKNRPGPALARESCPLDDAAIHEEIGLMLNALNLIHPVRQLIIFRRFFDDATYVAIATEIGRPQEWVRNQCLKAQKEIRAILGHRS